MGTPNKRAQAAWDGVIRQHVVFYSLIEWGDPSGYGARTACRGCGQRGVVISRLTALLDPERTRREREQLLRSGAKPYSREDRVSANTFERQVTTELTRGQFFHGAPLPICPMCGKRIVLRFLASPRGKPLDAASILIPAKGYSVLLSHGEPDPDGLVRSAVATDVGKPDLMRVAREIASQVYSDYKSARERAMGIPHPVFDLVHGTVWNEKEA